MKGRRTLRIFVLGKCVKNETMKFKSPPKNIAIYSDDLIAVDQEKFYLDCGVSKHFNNNQKIDVPVTRSIKALRSDAFQFKLINLV